MQGKKINNEHDLGYKHLLTHKKTFIGLLKSFIKENWVNDIDESEVALVNKSYVLQDFKEKESDIVYRLKIKDRNIIFYCLLELQSSVDYQMPIRLLFYMTEIWRDILKNTKKGEAERKGFRLPSIVPIVLYNGVNNWGVCRDFRDILDGNEMFLNHVLDFKYILFDVNRYKEEELLELSNLMSAVFLLDQKEGEAVTARLEKLVETFRKLSEEEFDLFKGWFKWIMKPRVSKELRPQIEDILEKAKASEVENMVYNLATTIEEMQKKAEEKGRVEGIEKGLEKGLEKAARSALENGADVDFVAKITGLDIEVINKFKREISKE